jgi:hypothetical protein
VVCAFQLAGACNDGERAVIANYQIGDVYVFHIMQLPVHEGLRL